MNIDNLPSTTAGISRGDVLTPIKKFENKHNITKTRNDMIPKHPYFREVDMDVKKKRAEVNRLLLKCGFDPLGGYNED